MMTRRSFGRIVGGSVVSAQAPGRGALAQPAARPNILWLTCEDTGPHLGCYGDTYADTPHLDRLAGRSLRYRHAWSNAPVCAPARTAIISGMYPQSTGAEHMRSLVRLPAGMKMLPQYLREAGYYTSNNSKEDYNLAKPGQVWDDSSTKGHWRNRGAGQPFFSVFNFTITHESQLRTRPHTWVHDPAKVRLPAYHPDTMEVRQDWAQYYDNITTMDGQAGAVLRQLEEEGLAGNTIVFFFGDHGSGMPRSKRWPYNSGLNVPLIAHFPEKLQRLAPSGYGAGAVSTQMVSFVDLAPTVLSIAGQPAPDHMQGLAFAGEFARPGRRFSFGFRGRMDERYDMVRSVRDERYVYVRNYMPHRIYGQHVAYMFETPAARVWRDQYRAGKLKPPQTQFWETKPAEELYDLQRDPDETRNLAISAAHRAVLRRLRMAQQKLAADIRDVGFLPEGEIHERSQGSTPYEMGHDRSRYPMQRIAATAELAAGLRPEAAPRLVAALGDPDSAVRYWGALGLLMRKQAPPALRRALEDSSLYVRVAAAEALGLYGSTADLEAALTVLLELAPAKPGRNFVSMAALNALCHLGPKARRALDGIASWQSEDPMAPERTGEYPARLLKTLPEHLAGN